MEIGYRSDNCIGGSEMNAAQVMAFETYEFGNSDILLTLANGVLKDSVIAPILLQAVDSGLFYIGVSAGSMIASSSVKKKLGNYQQSS